MKKRTKILIAVLAAVCIILTAGIIAGYNLFYKTPDFSPAATDKEVTLIAHRGMRSLAPENTSASFKKAGEYGYDGAECDVFRTADGAWVVSHDVNTFRMMSRPVNIEKSTYAELCELTVDNGTNIDDYPNLTICSLEEYIKICKEYDMTAFIELKSENNTEYYQEIVDIVERYGVDVTYISFYEADLKAMRELTDADLYYLADDLTAEAVEIASSIENCGIDFGTSNFDEFDESLVDTCNEKNIKLAAWTVNDTDLMEQLIAYGVDVITTDGIYHGEGQSEN